MDIDSDDALFDDLDIDDATLAAIDAQEKLALASLDERPPKRQKLDNNGITSIRPAPIAAPQTSALPDEWELPEISINTDLTLASISRPKPIQAGQPATVSKTKQKPKSDAAKARLAAIRSAISTRNSQQSSNSLNSTTQPNPQLVQPRKPSAHLQDRPALSTTTHPHGHRSVSPLVQQTSATSDELEVLRTRLEEIRQQNETLQSALKQAEDARMIKEGEATTLRRTMERSSKSHSEQVDRLKTENDAIVASNTQLKKEMKDELERMRTQFIFKQHEAETAARKPPGSIRSKRPVAHTPSQRDARRVSRTPIAEETPSRSRNGPSKPPQSFKSPESSRNLPMLRGFHNSFLESTPSRPVRGKTTVIAPPLFSQAPPLIFAAAQHVQPPGLTVTDAIFESAQDVDVQMGDLFDPIPPLNSSPVAQPPLTDDAVMGLPAAEELEEVEPFNWGLELSRVVLTYSGTSSCPIFQSLMGVNWPSKTDNDLKLFSVYSQKAANVLYAISASSTLAYEISLDTLTVSLIDMTDALAQAALIDPLVLLLDLMSQMSMTLQDFTSALLSHTSSDTQDQPRILSVLFYIIERNMEPEQRTLMMDNLANQYFTILEAFFWRLPEYTAHRLSYLARNDDIFTLLLQDKQSPWLLARLTSLLATIASNHHLYRHLLQSSTPGKDPVNGDLPKYFDRLLLLLIDPKRNDSESESMKENILIFLAQLLTSHADVHTTLDALTALLPSLVLLLSQVTIPLWEECEEVIDSPELAAKLIRRANQILWLLHYMVTSPIPPVNLRHKLHHANQRVFRGIHHVFTVTLGRLACADPPEWLGVEERYELSTLATIADSLLEFVLGGQDTDNVWEAFQDSESFNEDDEEAQLMEGI